MESKKGFLKMNLDEFRVWIQEQRIGRTIISVQQHHTWIPSYIHFKGNNHFERQSAMKNHHVNNGFSDIAQHFTSFPDGSILTGRSLEMTPAGIKGANRGSICIEHIGDFDAGGDTMTNVHKETIIKMTAILCEKFRLPLNEFGIIYHHWFQLDTGRRNDGAGGNKSCPGTNFFGGNKVEDFKSNFLPLVAQNLHGRPLQTPAPPAIQRYVSVTANRLNVRQQPSGSAPRVVGRESVQLGAILRVYGESNGWLKISNSQSHWVYAKYTSDVKRATVNASALRVRSGPGTNYAIVDSLMKSEEVFISNEVDGWCKISMEEKWLSKSYLDFS